MLNTYNHLHTLEARNRRFLLTVTATMPRSRTESYINPLELICTASPLKSALRNHGSASPTSRSNTFEPNVFETPISTKPKHSTVDRCYSIFKAHTLTNNHNAAQRIWNATSCGKKGDSHHAVRYAERETNHRDHPHHKVR
jgi:hypothetical protein